MARAPPLHLCHGCARAQFAGACSRRALALDAAHNAAVLLRGGLAAGADESVPRHVPRHSLVTQCILNAVEHSFEINLKSIYYCVFGPLAHSNLYRFLPLLTKSKFLHI